jgi:hypothetical protein
LREVEEVEGVEEVELACRRQRRLRVVEEVEGVEVINNYPFAFVLNQAINLVVVLACFF